MMQETKTSIVYRNTMELRRKVIASGTKS